MNDMVGMTDMSAGAPRGGAPPAVPPGLVTACRDLAARYRGVFSAETVLRTVYESYQLFIATSGRMVDAVPGVGADSGAEVDRADVGVDAVAHATRFAADWLADSAENSPPLYRVIPPSSRRPRVLFVCLHDTGRAQMAEALLRRRAGGRVAVRSAGPVAGRAIQPAVVAAMAELGIGISAEYPQPLLDDVVRAADVVVTMGCGDICPVYFGKRYLDWPLRHTTGSGVVAVRAVRDQIDVYVGELLDEITRRPPRGEYGRLNHGGGLRRQYN
jgi:arsenate reductase